MGLLLSAFRRIVFILTTALLGIAGVSAQDPQFSQYYANPLYTNPAFAGSSNVGRGVLNYRSQWPTISGTFKTYSASYDEHYDMINGGIGIIVTNDEAGVGVLRTLSISGIYSYQINITKELTVRAAIQGGYYQKSVDFSKLTFYDQILKKNGIVRPTLETPPANPIYYTNLATGFILYSRNFYGGFALHNLTQPTVSFFNPNGSDAKMKLRMRYTIHAGGMIPLIRTRDEKKSSNLWPNILYMEQYGAVQINLGMYYNKGPLVLGTYFRQNANYNSDAVIFLVGFRLPKMRFGLSYDHTVSDAAFGAKQSYEASLAFELRKRAHKKTIRAIRCPEF